MRHCPTLLLLTGLLFSLHASAAFNWETEAAWVEVHIQNKTGHTGSCRIVESEGHHIAVPTGEITLKPHLQSRIEVAWTSQPTNSLGQTYHNAATILCQTFDADAPNEVLETASFHYDANLKNVYHTHGLSTIFHGDTSEIEKNSLELGSDNINGHINYEEASRVAIHGITEDIAWRIWLTIS